MRAEDEIFGDALEMGTFRKVNVPEGESGDWKVSRVTVSADQAALHSLKPTGRSLRAGAYTELTDRGGVVMSDTPAEIRDLYPLAGHLRGRLLLNGLGLGVALQGALDRTEVEHVTVVELSGDVIALVAGHYKARHGDRLTVVHADAFEWKPPKGARWDAVWHDIWPNICGDDWEAMKALHRKYGRRCDWQGSWCREQVKGLDSTRPRSFLPDRHVP